MVQPILFFKKILIKRQYGLTYIVFIENVDRKTILTKRQFGSTHTVFQENFDQKTIWFNSYFLLRKFDQKIIRFYPLYSFRKNLNKRQYKGQTLTKRQHLKLDLKDNLIKRLMILWFKLPFKKILIKNYYGLTHIVCKNFILSNSTAIQSILLFQNSLIKR